MTCTSLCRTAMRNRMQKPAFPSPSSLTFTLEQDLPQSTVAQNIIQHRSACEDHQVPHFERDWCRRRRDLSGQDRELAIPDLFNQYTEFARLLDLFPDWVECVMLPGNHDAVLSAEPQPT